MGSAENVHNRTFAALRAEVVLKDDGRYLIYYSLPVEDEADDAGAAESEAGGQPPGQQPWSPDREPHV